MSRHAALVAVLLALGACKTTELERKEIAIQTALDAAFLACQACHMIPGITGPDTYVGPPLDHIAERKFLAGRLPNSAANLARWIRAPQEIDPGTAMPQLGVSERDAKDMAAYLMAPR